jgi:GntR family transcriptional regulator
MNITVDDSSPIPVFSQLIGQIRDGVSSGELRPGMALPTIRQLATDLGLNPGTVAKAYRLLERDSIIETRGSRGSFIHTAASEHSKVDLSGKARSVISDAVETLRGAGLTDSEIRKAFGEAMKA